MTHSEIAKKVHLFGFYTLTEEYFVYYYFDGKRVNLRIDRKGEDDLLALVEGEMCQFEALSIAIMNEVQKEAAAVAHRAETATKELHPTFQAIFKGLGMGTF